MDRVHRDGPWTGSMGWSMDRVHRGGPWTRVHVLYTSLTIRSLSFQAERKPLSTSEHGLKTVDNIYRKHDHKIANTLSKKAKLTQKLQANSQMEQEQSILGFLKWLRYFHHQYKTETFLQASTCFFRRSEKQTTLVTSAFRPNHVTILLGLVQF